MTVTRADEFLDAYRAHARTIDAPVRDVDMLRALATCAGWGARAIAAPLLPSGISHGVPWELSLAIGSRDLRVFVEPQSHPPTPSGYWHAANCVTAFAAEHGAHVDRLRTITRGFEPDANGTFASRDGTFASPDGTFAAVGDARLRPPRVWHAVALPVDGPPRWHAYVTCPSTADALAALERIDVPCEIDLRGDDRITIVSLDLVEHGRVKAYVLMANASIDELPRESRGFARHMLGIDAATAVDIDRRVWWLVAHELSSGTSGGRPARAVHFAARHLDAATMRTRVAALLDSTSTKKGQTLFPDVRPTDSGPASSSSTNMLPAGELHYVSFQLRDGTPRITVYFEPRVQRGR